MRRLAWQSSAEAGEDALAELRIILDETLDRVRSEIFGAGHTGPHPDGPEAPESAAETPAELGDQDGPEPEPPAGSSSAGGSSEPGVSPR
jgi:hypothetical protein